MTEPNDVADELIRRAYINAPRPGFDVSAGLADMHVRIRESGLLSTPDEQRDPHFSAGCASVTSFAPGNPETITGSQNSHETPADMRRTGISLRRGARIAGSTRDKLAADLKRKYERGASIRALAESTGRLYGFIHRVLSEAGVQLRGRGGATRIKKK
jgi:hypothetical protein